MEQEERFDNESFRDTISTVDADGKRVWVYPKKQLGKNFTKEHLLRIHF